MTPFPRPAESRPRRERLQDGVWIAALGAGLLAWCFGAAIWGERSFAFRDAGHFYRPLFQFAAEEWRAGRIPLWNPHDDLGAPLAAENSSSVFYPGQLIFALPIDFTLSYNFYVVGHLVLAATTAFCCARAWGRSVLAAGAAALSYAFGGSVLFMHCNVIYLVSAAWLPAALQGIDNLLRGGRMVDVFRLGLLLALMILGGDPQMAYHVGLFGLLLVWLRRREMGAGGRGTGELRLLGMGGLVALGLSAIQVIPTWELARHSSRASYDAPRSVYELAATLGRKTGQADDRHEAPLAENLLGSAFDRQGKPKQAYEFSVGPWRLAELFWPNCFGRQFPVHRRWINVLPREGRVWTPSLYLGLLPLLLALSSWRRRHDEPAWRWLRWLAAASLAASFGLFGLGWLAREISQLFFPASHFPDPLGDAFGGLYHLAHVMAPGYAFFRYPAKLLVPFAAGVSLLAAAGWDNLAERRPGWRLALTGLAGASLILWLVVLVADQSLRDLLSSVRPDSMFGPLDVDGALADLRRALLHTALAASLLALILAALHQTRWRFWEYCLLLVVAIDLAAAHAWLVPTIDADEWQRPSPLAEMLKRSSLGGRTYRDDQLVPPSWRETSSPDRLAEDVRWDLETLWPRYHLRHGISLAESSHSLSINDYRTFLEIARRHGAPRARGGPRPRRSALDLVGARFWILPAADRPDDLTPVPGVVLPEMAVWESSRAMPRAWIVHQVELAPPLEERRGASLEERIEQVLFPAGKERDWRTSAVVEAAGPLTPALAPPPPGSGEKCQIVVDEPQRVEIEAELAATGLVVLADQFFPGWELEVVTADRSRPATILRANRVLRGTLLPAGKHRLIYRYRPASFAAGLFLSALAWLATAIVLAVRR